MCSAIVTCSAGTVASVLQSDRVVAATVPGLVAQRSSEFDDAPTAPSNSGENSSVPPFPEQVSPDTPLRPELAEPTDSPRLAAPQALQPGTFDEADVYRFYINGIQTEHATWEDTLRMIDNNLLSGIKYKAAPVKTYNNAGSIGGDISESAIQYSGQFLEKVQQNRTKGYLCLVRCN
jgi:hypothetical protein